MAATKNLRTIIAAATSNGAGSSTTGTVVNLTTAYGGLLTALITNGGTGPTVPAALYVYTSGDNVNFKQYAVLPTSTVAGAAAPFNLEIPAGVMYLRADVHDNTGQAVTCEAFFQELTTI